MNEPLSAKLTIANAFPLVIDKYLDCFSAFGSDQVQIKTVSCASKGRNVSLQPQLSYRKRADTVILLVFKRISE